MTDVMKLNAFERLERFCKKFCAAAGRVDIIMAGSMDGQEKVTWAIRGKYDDGDFSEEVDYYGPTLLDAINTMPK